MKILHRFLPKCLLLSLYLLAACTTQKKAITTDKDIIQDTYWMLVSLEGEEMQGPTDTKTAYIRFEEGKPEVKGFTGCNNFFGKYELQGDSLRLFRLNSTRMMCPAIAHENKFMAILERADAFRIADYLLTLYGDGKAIATFRAGNDQGLTEQ